MCVSVFVGSVFIFFVDSFCFFHHRSTHAQALPASAPQRAAISRFDIDRLSKADHALPTQLHMSFKCELYPRAAYDGLDSAARIPRLDLILSSFSPRARQ